MNLRSDNLMITDDILSLLVCPESKQRLHWAEPPALEMLKLSAQAGDLRTVGGSPVSPDFESVLVREDGKVGYPVRSGIPILLIDQGILLS